MSKPAPSKKPTYKTIFTGTVKYIGEPDPGSGAFPLEHGRDYYVNAVMNIYTGIVFARISNGNRTGLWCYANNDDFRNHWGR